VELRDALADGSDGAGYVIAGVVGELGEQWSVEPWSASGSPFPPQ
jgi:hypothetical protein